MLQSSRKRPQNVSEVERMAASAAACERCRSRKVKAGRSHRECGAELPRCHGCVKADTLCIIADPSAPRAYTREEISALEEKLRCLEEKVVTIDPTNSSNTARDAPQHLGHTAADRDTLSPDFGRYVGQDKGVSFLLTRLHSTSNRSQQDFPLWRPGDTPKQFARIEYHPPHPFPTYHVAIQTIDEYFREFHMAHPLLERQALQACLDQAPKWAKEEPMNLTSEERHSIFQLHMAIAIGSIRLFRDNVIKQHPFGFFTAALEINPPAEATYNTLGSIENLILIARFGGYYNIGCSLWELSRLCIRRCIELDLHMRHPKSCGSDTALLQRSQKVFWEAYLLDRFSSRTLGRPFAISDRLIFADVPSSIPNSQGATGSVFEWLVGIGRLSSRIHSAMDERRPGSGASISSFPVTTSKITALDFGETLCQLRCFHRELSNWRVIAPSIDNPKCQFEASEFFELTYQEERLRLIGATIEGLGSNTMLPPDVLLQLCLQAARAIIHSFTALRAKNLINFSRTCTHLIFIASLVVVVSLEMRVHQQDELHPRARSSGVDAEGWLQDLFDDRWDPEPKDIWNDMSVAGSLLSWLADCMPDMAVYNQLFQSLRHQVAVARSSDAEKSTHLGVPNVDKSGHEGPYSSRNSLPSEVLRTDDDITSIRENAHEVSGTEVNFDFSNMQMENTEFNGLGGDTMPAGWSLAYVLGIEGISAGLSEFVWDTAVPWRESPVGSSDF